MDMGGHGHGHGARWVVRRHEAGPGTGVQELKVAESVGAVGGRAGSGRSGPRRPSRAEHGGADADCLRLVHARRFRRLLQRLLCTSPCVVQRGAVVGRCAPQHTEALRAYPASCGLQQFAATAAADERKCEWAAWTGHVHHSHYFGPDALVRPLRDSAGRNRASGVCRHLISLHTDGHTHTHTRTCTCSA